jgi:hypothetical protein
MSIGDNALERDEIVKAKPTVGDRYVDSDNITTKQWLQ